MHADELCNIWNPVATSSKFTARPGNRMRPFLPVAGRMHPPGLEPATHGIGVIRGSLIIQVVLAGSPEAWSGESPLKRAQQLLKV